MIGWLDELAIGDGDALFIRRLDGVTALPEDYVLAYHEAALIWQGTVYGGRDVSPEELVRLTLLLTRTEELLWPLTDRRQRFRLRYVLGLCA